MSSIRKLSKTYIITSFRPVNSIRYFSQKDDSSNEGSEKKDPQQSDHNADKPESVQPTRREEARGAMRSFIDMVLYNQLDDANEADKPTATKSLWAKLSAQQAQSNSERIFNSRFSKQSSSPFKKQGPRGGGNLGKQNQFVSSDYDSGGDGGGGPFRSKSYDPDNDDFDPELGDREPSFEQSMEEVEHMFSGHSEDYSYKGMEIDTNDMDEVDKFFADVYTESQKTTDHTYVAFLKNEQFNRVQIPKPRTLAQLLHTITPEVPPEVTHPYARKLLEQSWEVLSKNIYLNEHQKRYMSQSIGRKVQKLFEFEADYEAHKKRTAHLPLMEPGTMAGPSAGKLTREEEYALIDDIIFDTEFKRGPLYREKLQKEGRLRALKPSDEFAQEETDWKQEAVESEDDLVIEGNK